MRKTILSILLLASVAAAQTLPPGTAVSPFKLKANVLQVSLMDSLTDPLTVVDYNTDGTADDLTLEVASTTPTARRGSGNYTQVTWENEAGDYLSFELPGTANWSDYGYLSMWMQTDDATVSSVAAVGTLTLSGLPSNGDTFVIDTLTYTLVTTSTGAARQIVIGGSVALTCTAIAAGVNSVGLTTAEATATTVVLTAATPGVAGDALVLTESMANTTVDGAGTLGGTTAGVDPTYTLEFLNAASVSLGTADVPGIAAAVWAVAEIPVSTINRSAVKFIHLISTTAQNGTVTQLERMVLSDYANGCGPVMQGAIAVEVTLATGATTVNRGELVGYDPGGFGLAVAVGVSDEALPIGYAVGGIGQNSWAAGESFYVQVAGPIYLEAAAGLTTAGGPIWATSASLVDGTPSGGAALGVSLEAASAVGAHVQAVLGATAGTTTESVGAAGSSGTAQEYGDGFYHTSVISGISITGAVTSAGSEAVTGIGYTFPRGGIIVHQVMFNGRVYSPTVTDIAAEFAVGSVAGTAGLSTTEQDLMIAGALDGAITTTPGVVHQDVTLSSLNGAGVTPAWFDGTTTQGSVQTANISIADLSWSASDDVTITGTLYISWSYLGDF